MTRLPDYLPDTEVGVLLGQPDSATWLGRRDILLMSLMLRCGLRQGEARLLEPVHVSFDRDVWWLRVRHTKRTVGKDKKAARHRNIPVPDEVGVLLADWVSHDLPEHAGVLLPTKRGTPLSQQAVWKMVRKHAEDAGCQRVWPHMLRHTFATEALEQGLTLAEVSMVLGHASLSSSQIYLHARPESVKEKMKGWTR